MLIVDATCSAPRIKNKNKLNKTDFKKKIYSTQNHVHYKKMLKAEKREKLRENSRKMTVSNRSIFTLVRIKKEKHGKNKKRIPKST